MKKYNYLLASAATFAVASVFEPNKAGWKVDAEGKIEVKDGNPVYVDSNGREQTMDAGRITQLNGEAMSHRTRAEAAEAALKQFEGIDPAKAKAALDTVAKIDQKTLIDAGEVDKVRSEIESAFTGQLTEAREALEAANAKIDNMRLTSAFGLSKYVDQHVAIPVDVLAASFGSRFKVENDILVPYGPDGQKMYSKEHAGQVASFDEGLKMMIESREDKASFLRAEPKGGTGNDGKGGERGQGATITRADFDRQSPIERAATAREAAAGKISIVD